MLPKNLLQNAESRAYIQKVVVVGLISLAINTLNFLFNVLLARGLPSKEFAVVSAFIGIIYLIQLPLSAVETAVVKSVAGESDGALDKRKVENLGYLSKPLRFSFAVGFLMLLLVPIISRVSSLESKQLIYIALISIPFAYSPFLKGMMMGMQRINLNYALLFLETVVKITLLWLLLSWSNIALSGLLAFTLPTIAILIAYRIFLYRINGKKWQLRFSNSLNFKEMSPVILILLLFYCGFTLDLILTPEDIRAEYSALALLGKTLFYGSVLFVPLMVALTAKSSSTKSGRLYFLATVLLGFIGTVVILTLYQFWGEYFVNIIFDGSYLGIVDWLIIYSISMGMYAMSFISVNYLLVRGKYSVMWILLLLPVLQITLFSLYNETLKDIVINQFIAQTVVFILIAVYLFWLGLRDEE